MWTGVVVIADRDNRYRPTVFVTAPKDDQETALSEASKKAATYLRMKMLFASVDDNTSDLLDAAATAERFGTATWLDNGYEWTVTTHVAESIDALRPL